MTPAGFYVQVHMLRTCTCVVQHVDIVRECTHTTPQYTGNMAGFSDQININHVTGHVCRSVYSESVYSPIRLNRMWLLNGVRYNIWREGEMLAFPVWREVWNGVQLQVWQLVEWTGMETTSTHNLTFSEMYQSASIIHTLGKPVTDL